jgi:hypothetical protein
VFYLRLGVCTESVGFLACAIERNLSAAVSYLPMRRLLASSQWRTFVQATLTVASERPHAYSGGPARDLHPIPFTFRPVTSQNDIILVSVTKTKVNFNMFQFWCQAICRLSGLGPRAGYVFKE